jgi:hypothetical protein
LKKPVTESLSSRSRAAESLENTGQELPVDWALSAGRNVDALFNGEGAPLPSTVILDYVYGVAAYNSWRSKNGDVSRIMDEYRKKNYLRIKPHTPSLPDDIDDAIPESDHSTDLDYNPADSQQKRYKRKDESGMGKAMDELNLILMLVSGTTPEQVAERREKQIEQEERAAQEVSRSKVIEWRKHMDV